MIQNPVFKFVSVRAPQSPSNGRVVRPPAFDDTRRTTLHTDLLALDGTPSAAVAAAAIAAKAFARERYVLSAPEHAGAVATLDAVVRELRAMGAAETAESVARRIEKVAGADPARLVADKGFDDLKEAVWNGVYAGAILPRHRPDDRERLYDHTRALYLIEVLAQGQLGEGPVPLRGMLQAAPVIPADLLPRASARPPQAGDEGGSEECPGQDERSPGPDWRERIVRHRDALEAALAEVNAVYRRNRERALAEGERRGVVDTPATLPGRSAGNGKKATARRKPTPEPGSTSLLRPAWRLSRGDLGEATLALLDRQALSVELDDAHAIAYALQREMGRANRLLSGPAGPAQLQPFGAGYARGRRSDAFSFVAPGPFLLPPTGPLTPAEPIGGTEPVGDFKILGIGDLLVVRETLLRYEAGEVAHIENVLQSEKRERRHRRRRLVEETVSLESERSEEEERDLETTERFELSRESEKTIETDVSASAGVTVSASYGFVDVTAQANFAYNSSQSESTRTSSDYARSVTERAVSRIKQRVREERVRRTVDEFEEKNLHSYDNSGGPGHVRGLYRWVDKLYSAQIVNYGRRLMLEFVLPEPAAFYIHAQRASPLPGLTLEEPASPESLGLLSHRDLRVDNYDDFVARYRVEDATPPPPARKVVGLSLDQPAVENSLPFAKSSQDLVVPAGYVAGIAAVSSDWIGSKDVISGSILVGANSLSIWDTNPTHRTLNYEDAKVPFSILADVNVYIVNAEVECSLTPEAWEDWQLKTYTAILGAYRSRRSEYQEQLAAARVRQGLNIQGRNPARNRAIEQEELKKSCISLLSRQRFEDFGAITSNPDPAFGGWPEIDVAQAGPEGDVIQFLEQCFEWDQMTYLFYPYFWGRKANWLDVFPLEDVDPKFTDFLRAGAARAVVPVRPPYNDAVLLYVASEGKVRWNGGAAPTLGSGLYRAISEELRERRGDRFVDREGTLSPRLGVADVDGVGTDFSDDDVDREIRIAGVAYRIAAVSSSVRIVLREPYRAADADGVPFATGGRLVGEPWEVRVPTSLVYLSDNAILPDFTAP